MLVLDQISKRFGATLAVDGVSLAVAPGQIVGLVGENGAGKTTLMRIVAGEIASDAGNVTRPSPTGMVHQHFTLVGGMTVAENLALVREKRLRLAGRRDIERAAQRDIDQSGIRLDGVSRLAAELSVGEKAKLELIKALALRPQLLILDEPTSVLTPLETAELFEVIRRLAAAGTAVVFISHKVPEVLEIAGRIVVMRGGGVVADRPAASTTGLEIARAMIGDRDLPSGRRDVRSAAGASPSPLVRLQSVSGSILDSVSLTVSRREIVAIVGVAGNGQSELIEVLRGLRRPRGGRIELETTRLGFIPEDRTRDALVAPMTIAENLALGARQWSPRRAEHQAERLINLYAIRASGPRQLAGELSGGNQQKVVLARELDRRPDLIVAAEPTRGLDLESTRYVHQQLELAVAAGAGLLLVTSDLDEAFSLADAVHVIYRGRLSERLTPGQASQRVAQLMAGVA